MKIRIEIPAECTRTVYLTWEMDIRESQKKVRLIVGFRNSPTLEMSWIISASEDARRNALNGHCYWMFRQQGKSVEAATIYLLRVMNGSP